MCALTSKLNISVLPRLGRERGNGAWLCHDSTCEVSGLCPLLSKMGRFLWEEVAGAWREPWGRGLELKPLPPLAPAGRVPQPGGSGGEPRGY